MPKKEERKKDNFISKKKNLNIQMEFFVYASATSLCKCIHEDISQWYADDLIINNRSDKIKYTFLWAGGDEETIYLVSKGDDFIRFQREVQEEIQCSDGTKYSFEEFELRVTPHDSITEGGSHLLITEFIKNNKEISKETKEEILEELESQWSKPIEKLRYIIGG